MNMKQSQKITVGGLLLAMSLLLPQLFHLTGAAASGAIFLPMHIPVLLCGFLIGPWYGLAVGVIAPIISWAVTAMPAASRLPFMIGELAVYGLVSGLLYCTLGLRDKKFGALISLVGAMAAGRAFYAAELFVAANLLGIKCGGAAAMITATVTGLPGIVIQLVLIPPVVMVLEKFALRREKKQA